MLKCSEPNLNILDHLDQGISLDSRVQLNLDWYCCGWVPCSFSMEERKSFDVKLHWLARCR